MLELARAGRGAVGDTPGFRTCKPIVASVGTMATIDSAALILCRVTVLQVLLEPRNLGVAVCMSKDFWEIGYTQSQRRDLFRNDWPW